MDQQTISFIDSGDIDGAINHFITQDLKVISCTIHATEQFFSFAALHYVLSFSTKKAAYLIQTREDLRSISTPPSSLVICWKGI